jgi:hypothetical protein
MGTGLALILQQIGTATASAVTGGGFATGAAASQGLAGGIGVGVKAGAVASQALTAASVAAPLMESKPKDLNKPITNIKTNVGDDVAPKKKRKSVASTVQGGGLKRNSLG